MKRLLGSIFSEQFMDELAERVADKLAKRNQKGMNVIFREPPKMHYYESGCGNHNAFPPIYDSCGGSSKARQTYSSSCGGERQKPWRSEC
jgi:hypothetical protein